MKIYFNRRKIKNALLLFFLIAGICLYLSINGWLNHILPILFVGIFGWFPMLFVLGMFIKFYNRSRTPAIQFEEHTLSVVHFPGYITQTDYLEITGAAIIRFQRSERVVVYLKDPVKWMSSQPAAYQNILRWTDRLFQSPLSLSFTFTDSNPIEIMQLFQKHLPHLAGGETFENNR